MDESKLTYDPVRRRLVYVAAIRGKNLLPKDIGLSLSRLARSGSWKEESIESVAVQFSDLIAAKHNAGPLKFLGLESQHDGVVVGSEDRFTVRKDFGLED